MQDPNADTQWNDILREKGVLPQKKEKELTEDEVVAVVENAIQDKLTIADGKTIDELTLDELDELEDEEDERVLLEYRKQRLAEMKLNAMQSKFGDVREISANDYVEQVNKAGDGIWVVLHLYKPGIPLCTLLNNYIIQLAAKFPQTKFLKSVSDTCIPNFPDRNLPTIFIYRDGQMKKQFVGPDEVGGLNLKLDELEWMLSEVGAVKSDLESNPRKRPTDVLMSSLRQAQGDDDTDDW